MPLEPASTAELPARTKAARMLAGTNGQLILTRRPGAVFAAGKPAESPARARTVRKPGSDQPIPVTLFGGEVDAVDTYAAAGVGRVLFFVRPLGTVEMTRLVDQIALRLGNRLKRGTDDHAAPQCADNGE